MKPTIETIEIIIVGFIALTVAAFLKIALLAP